MRIAAALLAIALPGCTGTDIGSSGSSVGGVAGGGGVGGTGPTCRETVRLAPLADTYVDATDVARAHGNSLTLKLGGSEGVADRFRMLVAFDLEGAAPASAHLLDAWIEIQAGLLTDIEPMGATVHRLNREFDEDSATWEEFQLDDAWSTPGGDFDARAAATRDAISVDSLTSFDVFDDFARQLSEGVPYYGWMIRSTSTGGAEIHSRERAPGISPILVLEYCPQ